MSKHNSAIWVVIPRDYKFIPPYPSIRIATIQCPREEWIDNMHLIMAAPATLNALEELLWAISGIEYVETEYAEQVGKARLAVARARGKM